MEQELEQQVELVTKILSSTIPIVYFLRCNEYVKIGTTNGNLLRRIADLQVGNPYTLELEFFVLGGNKTEREIHKVLLKYWTRGEWHKITKKELLQEIKKYGK